jgi:AcrR family transcriptional regulator
MSPTNSCVTRTVILDSQSIVSSLSEEFASRALERTIAERRDEYVQEIQRIVDATYRVIERTDQVDPSLRDVLKEAKLSTQGFYRYFQSKDELLLLLLDDGRRRLLSYLEHRMDRATTPEGRVRAWVEGVLAQASRPDAASRTRPFLANQDRLAAAYPEEQQRSVDALVDLLAATVSDLRPGRRRDTARRDAEAIYHLAFGVLHVALRRGEAPSAAETEHLVRFCLQGLGDT